MRIIYTHDGMIGLHYRDKPVVWCDSKAQATELLFAHFSKLGKDTMPTKQEVYESLCYSIDECAKRHDDIIEWGVFGDFMYTTRSKEE